MTQGLWSGTPNQKIKIHWTHSKMKNSTFGMWMKVALLMCLRCNLWTCFPDCYRGKVLGHNLTHFHQWWGGIPTNDKVSCIEDSWREAAWYGYFMCSFDSGYIKTVLFADYGENFVNYLRQSDIMIPSIKQMILLDLHENHLFNLQFMQLWKGITLRSAHFHLTTHMCSSH